MAVKTINIAEGDDEYIEDCDVLIFTAIEELEAKALNEHLVRVGAAKVAATRAERHKGLQRWSLPTRNAAESLRVVTHCLNRAGNGIAGIELSHLLHTQTHPRLVVFCGIGGSLDPQKAQLGNVIVSDSIHWRGFDKISGDSISKAMRRKNLGDHTVNGRLLNSVSSFISENDSLPNKTAPAVGLFPTDKDSTFRSDCDKWLKSVAADEDMKDDIADFQVFEYHDRVKPIVRRGKFMSWDFVLNKKTIRQGVKEDDKDYYVVEMESGGMALALKNAKEFFKTNTELLVVRGISDLCNKKTDDVFRFLAADHAAAFLTGYLKAGYDPGF